MRGEFANFLWPDEQFCRNDLRLFSFRPCLYRSGADASRLYLLLAALWSKMRETMFAVRPTPKKRGPAGPNRHMTTPTPAAKLENGDVSHEVWMFLSRFSTHLPSSSLTALR